MRIKIEILGREFGVSIAHKPDPEPAPTDEELQRKWTQWQANTRTPHSPVIGFGSDLSTVDYPHRRWGD